MTRVLDQDNFVVAVATVMPADVFTTTSTGTVAVTVNWTSASNDVDLFLVRGNAPCTLASFIDRSCGFVVTAETLTAKPEKLSAPNLAPGTYTLYIANFGETDEVVSCEILLTTATGAFPGSVTTAAVGGSRIAKGRLNRLLEPHSQN